MIMKKLMKIIMRCFNAIKNFFVPNVYVTVRAINPAKLLENKAVAITGGSSGIGFAIAQKALEQGAKVVITGTKLEKLEKAKKQLNSYGQVHICQWNIADTTQCEAKIKEIIQLLDGRLNCWVNNAGIFKPVDFSTCTETDWSSIIDTNLKGPYFATNEIVKYFVRQHIEGNVVNVSSETGDTASTSPYAFSKIAIDQYTKGLAYALSKKNIRVNAIAPGGTATEIAGINPNEAMNWKGLGGRLLSPEELAEVVIFLLSDTSKCINGEVITCNQGNTLKVEYFR